VGASAFKLPTLSASDSKKIWALVAGVSQKAKNVGLADWWSVIGCTFYTGKHKKLASAPSARVLPGIFPNPSFFK
jgi:hypothetical protein